MDVYMSEQEAKEWVENFKKEKGLDKLPDTVLPDGFMFDKVIIGKYKKKYTDVTNIKEGSILNE